MTKLLRTLGCDCAQERYFPSLEKKGGCLLSPMHRFHVRLFRAAWPMPPWGEAAWQSAPFIQHLPCDTVVFHQVRNPIRFIRSRQKKGLTCFPFRARYCPIAVRCSDAASFRLLPIEEQTAYLAEFWLRWNTMIESAARRRRLTYLRYRLENVDAPCVARMLTLMNFTYSPEKLSEAYATTSKRIHSRGETDSRITLDLLPDDLRERLTARAARYGYNL